MKKINFEKWFETYKPIPNHIDKKGTYCGIDRIDNTKSYIKENCVPCCNICNRMKLEMNTQEFIEHIRRIMEFYSDIRN